MKILKAILVIFSLLIGFLQTIVFAQTGFWSLQNPSTPVNTLSSLHFVDDQNGWTVGASGIILKTTDGGVNWNPQFSGTGNYLASVYFVDENIGWAVGDFGTIRKTTNGGQSWSAQSGGRSGFLKSVFFINSQIGWIAGSDSRGSSPQLLKTTDGGTTWNTQSVGAQYGFSGVFFVDANTGWTVGAFGEIYKTTNGGSSWSVKNSATTSSLKGIFFLNADTGWAVGGFGAGAPRIVKTIDGGETWAGQNAGTSEDLNSVYFVNDQVGWVVGRSSFRQPVLILKTTDGGATWIKQGLTNKDLEGTTLNSVQFFNPTTGIAVGLGGAILKTTDGGENWINQQKSVTKEDMFAVYFLDRNNGWAGGTSGSLVRTKDGGAIWTPVSIPSNISIYSMFFVDSKTGWLGTRRGMLNTVNGGKTWISNNIRYAIYGLYFTNENTGWAVGSGALSRKIFKTIDGGQTWITQLDESKSALMSVYFINDSIGWAVGQSGIILHTENGGGNWLRQTSGVSHWLEKVHFLNRNNGIVAGSGGFLQTTDGGKTWTKKNSRSGWIDDIFFTDELHGWAVGVVGSRLSKTINSSGSISVSASSGARSKVWMTEDGGNNWSEIILSTGTWLLATHFVDLNTGWAVGEFGNILKYTNTIPIPNPPPPPTLASPADGAVSVSTSPTLTWNASSGAASYRLQVSTNSTFSTTVVDQSGITGTSHTVSGLADSTKYYWRVNATSSAGTSDWSSVWSFTVGEGTALNPPRNLTAQSGVPGKVPLSWDAPGTALPDTIEITYDDGVAETALKNNSSGAELAVRFTPASYPVTLIGLDFLAAGSASNETYGIKIYLDPAAGNRGPTGTPAFTGALGFGSAGMIGAGFPNPITINSGDFYLALNSISGSTKDFAIGFDKTSDARRSWLSTGPGNFALSGNLGFPGNLIIRALVVTSGNSNLLATVDGPVGNLQVIEASGETPAQPFGYGEYTLLANSAPFFITSLFNASGQNGASNATLQGYNIYRATVSPVQVAPQNKIRHVGADTTTFDDTDVIGGAKYYYVATAVYSQGESGPSNEDSAISGLLAPVLASPDDGALNQPTTLAVRWNASAGAKTYRLQLSANADFSSAVFDDSTITATSQQVGPLNAATTYFWRMNAKNDAGVSDWSSVWRFTTGAGDGAMLRLLPAIADVIANGKVAVDVKIERAKNLGAFDLTLRYDPALLQVEQAEDVKRGAFLESTGRTVVALGPEIDSTAGTIRFGVASYGSQDGATGDGILATIRFKAVASADTTAEIVFESAQIGDIDGNELTLADSIGNNIRVTIQCADVDSDCDVDVVDIQLVAGRWNTRIGDALYDPRYDLDNQCSGDGDIDVVDIQICAGQWGWKCPSNSGAILSKVDGGVPVDISIALGQIHDGGTFELLIRGESAAKVSAFELAMRLPEEWAVRNYSPGEFLTGNGNTVVPLRKTDDDALLHIGAVTYGLNTTSAESGVLARLRIAGDPQRFADLVVESGLFAGKNGEPMRLGSIDIGVAEAIIVPTELALYPNYPNPFNPATIISFDLPAGFEGQTVVLNIYNLAGEKVRELVREPLTPGRHRFEWNSKDQQGRAVATGIYIARLHVGSLMKIRKMTLMK